MFSRMLSLPQPGPARGCWQSAHQEHFLLLLLLLLLLALPLVLLRWYNPLPPLALSRQASPVG